MKLLRIKLTNFKGVKQRELCFEPLGVTVVEGPNEIGKSCVAQALRMIFEFKADSKHRDVKAAKPADRDVGPEVEVEFETGAYHLVYFKRYLKKHTTELKITAPAAEALTGGEAHDRVREILDQTMDAALWDALQVMQGGGADKAALSEAGALSRALDSAAGQEVTGDHESSVFDAVEQERGRYYTETGKEKKELVEARAEVTKDQAEAARLEAKINDLQQLVERSAALDREIFELRDELTEAEQNSSTRQLQLEELKQLEGRAKLLEQRAKRAAEGAKRAVKDQEARATLAGKLDSTRQRERQLGEQVAEAEPDLQEARQETVQLEQQLKDADRAGKVATAAVDLRRTDWDFLRAQEQHADLSERRTAIMQAHKRRGAAAEVLARAQISAKLLKQIKKVQRDLELAQAQLSASSPQLEVRALASTTLELDGEQRQLDQGQTLEHAVGQAASLTVPGLLQLTVQAGDSLADLVSAQDKYADKLVRLLEQAGVGDLEQAERADLERGQAERDLEQAEGVVQDKLGQRSQVQLDAELEQLEARVSGYPERRPTEPPLAGGLAEAEEAAALAARKQADAEQARESARKAHSKATMRLKGLEQKVQGAKIELKLKSKEVSQLQDELQVARENITDQALEQAVAELGQAAATEQERWDHTRQKLERLEPEQVKTLAENAQAAASRQTRALRQREGELEKVTGQLEILGEQGLYDELARAQTAQEHARQQQASLLSRAGAAQLLYQTMKRQRDASRRSYTAPLKDKIEQLGRYVFDHSFGVELAPDLSIAARSIDDVPLPYDALSAGAQEQLGHVVRLACALVIDEADGVPLIFDDTLGHTDPLRLEGMGALLSRVGKQCQIIVLTCTPGRFKHIGDARTLSLVDGDGA